MEKIFGIDISVYQKGINLSKAKSEGVKFAILRAGYTGYGNGVSKAKDTEFEIHYRNAKNNGLGVGAYWFSRATTYENGKAEAKYMYENCLKGKQFEYPIYIDVEDGYYQAKVSKTDVANAIKGFCEYLESKGYYAGIYANVDWFRNRIDTASLNDYDKWIASWGTARPNYPEGGMWQFGGETNKIRSNRIAGMVCDQNYAFKDYPSIMKKCGLNGFTKAKEENNTNTPVAPKKTVEQLAKEVIEGKWGNGEERKKRLTEAGYNYKEVQNKVNELTKKPTYKTYTVKKGDTLSGIGAKFNVDWRVIAKDNNIEPPKYTIYAGQKLIIK
jgi:LysM repeat protein